MNNHEVTLHLSEQEAANMLSVCRLQRIIYTTLPIGGSPAATASEKLRVALEEVLPEEVKKDADEITTAMKTMVDIVGTAGNFFNDVMGQISRFEAREEDKG